MYYNQVKEKLIAARYTPLPVRPNSKIPAAKWAHDDYTPPEGFLGCGIGIKCGVGDYPIAGIDCDIVDIQIAKYMQDIILDIVGETVYRIGKAPKCFYVYRAEKPGIRKIRSAQFENLGLVELLGYGQQFVAYGTHPDTKEPYYWPGILGDLIDVPAQELPIVTIDQMREIITVFENKATDDGFKIMLKKQTEFTDAQTSDRDDVFIPEPPIGLSADKIRDMLKNLDPDCGRDQWRNIGMAIHHEFNGEPDGLALWDEWSAGGVKYKLGETAAQWASFGRYPGRQLTAAYLLKIAKKEPKIDMWETVSKIYVPAPDNRPVDVDPLITFNGRRVLSRGSIMAVGAQAGQGKSSVCTRILSTVVNPEAPNLGLIANCETAHIIDTEQSQIESHKQWRAFMKCANLDAAIDATPDSIQFENIRAMATVKERRAYLEKVLHDETIADLLILDGLSDFISAVNDETECTDIIGLISAVAHERQIGIVCSLHMNPAGATEKMRGVLGSELWRKAEFCAIIRKAEGAIRELTSGFSLGKNRSDSDTLNTFFTWDESEGLHVICDAPEKQKAKDKENKLQGICDLVIAVIQNETAQSMRQVEIIAKCKEHSIGRTNVTKALRALTVDGLLDYNPVGRSYEYFLTPEGQKYGLQIDT